MKAFGIVIGIMAGVGLVIGVLALTGNLGAQQGGGRAIDTGVEGGRFSEEEARAVFEERIRQEWCEAGFGLETALDRLNRTTVTQGRDYFEFQLADHLQARVFHTGRISGSLAAFIQQDCAHGRAGE